MTQNLPRNLSRNTHHPKDLTSQSLIWVPHEVHTCPQHSFVEGEANMWCVVKGTP